MELEYKLTRETGPELSEYDIIVNNKITVDEFIDYVLKERPDEKGTIGIADGGKHKQGEPRLTFGGGMSFSRSYLKDYLDMKIYGVHAYKFCGLMLYVITVDVQEHSTTKKMNLFSNRTKDNELQVILYEDKDCLYKAAVAKFKHVHEVASLFKDYKNHWCRVLKETPGGNSVVLYEGVFSNYFADEVVAYIKELENKVIS